MDEQQVNDIRVSGLLDGVVLIKVFGPLSADIDLLREFVASVRDVRPPVLVRNQNTLEVTPQLSKGRSVLAVREMIREKCSDFIANRTHIMANMENNAAGRYAYLEEDAPPVDD